MRDWIAAQLAGGLPAFAGSRISGTVAVSQEAATELIANWLAAATPGGAPPIDPRIARAAIKSLKVRADGGKIMIDVEISL